MHTEVKMNFEVTEEEYNQLMDLQKANGVPFSELIKGSRKTLMVFGRAICSICYSGHSLDIGNISDTQFNSFLALFKKSLYQRLRESDELLLKKVEWNGISRGKNHIEFQMIPVGTTFYNIDIASAYWQIAFRLGYISEKFFKKYLKNDDYKVVKRLCFSFLARQSYRTYSNNISDSYNIICDTSMDQQVYDNVRNELYSVIAKGLSVLETNYIDYNIDGISFLKENESEITAYFNEQNLMYKVVPVVKVSETHILIKDTIKKF